MIKTTIDGLTRYPPAKMAIFRVIGLWIFWVAMVHVAWLGKWYLLPVTGLILLPQLLWMLRHLTLKQHSALIECLKHFFEMMSGEIGSGKSLSNGLMDVVKEMQRTDKIVSVLRKPMENLLIDVELGMFNETSFNEIAGLADLGMMDKLSELLSACIKTGSPIDALLSQYAVILAEQLRHKRVFRQKLAEKRNEFQIMLMMPLGGIMFIKNVMYDYFQVLYSSVQGQLLLLSVTIFYSLSAHLFFANESNILSKEV